ncbi:MAG: lipid II flippase MurJ [Chloroflexia bacterium]
MLSLASVATALLQSYDEFTIPALAPIAYNTCIILGALLLAPVIGIQGVAIGVVIGSFFFLASQLPAARRRGLRLPREAPPANRDVRRTFRLLLPRVAGQSAVQLSTIVTFTLAAGLGDGRPAAYRYAFTLFVLPIGLFGTSIATVTFPAMSREAVEQDAEGFLYLVRRAIRGVLFFIIPAGLGLIALRYPIIEMIYERGEFDNRAAALVAEPLLYFAAGIWAYALVDVLPRAFYALQDSITPLKIAAVAVVLDVALSLLLSRLMGLGGLALAFSAATGLQVILLARALRSHVGPIVNASMWDYFYRLAIASSSMVFALYLAQPVLSEYQALALPGLVLRVGLVVGGSAAVYIFISYLLGQDEVGVLARLARRIT